MGTAHPEDDKEFGRNTTHTIEVIARTYGQRVLRFAIAWMSYIIATMEGKMKQRVILLVLLSTFLALAQPATAQIGRGAAGGALIGGIAGGGRGAAIGALIGAGTGAMIAREGRRRHGRYYWWHGNCYYHGRSGRWYRVSRRYC